MSPARTRVTVALTSLAAIALELALMRVLALRYWQHLAYMVISVALLGFGASGTFLTVFRRWIAPRRERWLWIFALGFAVSIPCMLHASRQVPLDVEFLAWDFSRVGDVAILEAFMLVPFFLAAGVVGVALMDRPEHLSGHYAANLLGSGAGAVAAVALMNVVDTTGLILAVTGAAALGAAVVVPWAHLGAIAGAVLLYAGHRGRQLLAAGAVALVLWLPYHPQMSPFKMLSLVRDMPDTKEIARADGPLGRIDVVAGPAIHHAPGLSLRYDGPIPPHALMIVDGDQTSAVYDPKDRQGWRFMDYTTGALPYHLRSRPRVLILGAGGGADIGLALYDHSADVTAIEMNPQVIDLMTGPLADRGGRIYEADGVRVIQAEARGYLDDTTSSFDVIQLPAIDAFGASGAGLQAAQESYLYTVQSLEAMLARLRPGGLLCLTRWARTPPRDGLRVFETARAALEKRGLDPAECLAMVRSWATVTVLVSPRPLSKRDCHAVREFCRERSFDVCYLPDIKESEVNLCHVLDQPYYYQGAQALLGPHRRQYLASYLFQLDAPTDDKPFFFHFFRWGTLKVLREQLGGRSRAYLELGYLMLLAALAQTVVLAAVMILLPLIPLGRRMRIFSCPTCGSLLADPEARGLRDTPRRTVALIYFLLLGAGFMFLEMGFLQKLILYLASPIYSAAAVIAGFLVFAGVGSGLSRVWSAPRRRVIAVSAGVVVCLGLVYLLQLDVWLKSTQASPMWMRFLLSAAFIAPLAAAMGHLFPTALRRVADPAPALVPWAWAVNGFASVVATVAAPLLAMAVGFRHVILAAIACYALAGVLGAFLPGGREQGAQEA